MSVWRWETEKIKKIVLKIKKIDDMRYTLQPSDGENPVLEIRINTYL